MESPLKNAYKKGQIDLFNRIWDAFNNTDDDAKGFLNLIRELNKIRKELTKK